MDSFHNHCADHEHPDTHAKQNKWGERSSMSAGRCIAHNREEKYERQPASV